MIPPIKPLRSIKINILYFGNLKVKARSVPPMGVNKKGVRNAIPESPNLDLTLMANLVVFVNVLPFFSLNLLKSATIKSWAKRSKTTVAIIPANEQKTVSQNVSPSAKPAIGPPTNLMVLAKRTEKNSAYFIDYKNRKPSRKIQYSKKLGILIFQKHGLP